MYDTNSLSSQFLTCFLAPIQNRKKLILLSVNGKDNFCGTHTCWMNVCIQGPL